MVYVCVCGCCAVTASSIVVDELWHSHRPWQRRRRRTRLASESDDLWAGRLCITDEQDEDAEGLTQQQLTTFHESESSAYVQLHLPTISNKLLTCFEKILLDRVRLKQVVTCGNDSLHVMELMDTWILCRRHRHTKNMSINKKRNK